MTRATATIEHTRIATGLSYDALVVAFERELGHLELRNSPRIWSSAKQSLRLRGTLKNRL